MEKIKILSLCAIALIIMILIVLVLKARLNIIKTRTLKLEHKLTNLKTDYSVKSKHKLDDDAPEDKMWIKEPHQR